MPLDPVELEQRLQVRCPLDGEGLLMLRDAAGSAEQSCPVKEAARRACEAAGRLVRHREGFIARAEGVLNRDLVILGKVANVVASGVGVALLFTPAAPAGAGILAGVVGGGAAIVASCHDSDLDRRKRELGTELSAFIDEDRKLAGDLSACCEGFIQLLQKVDCEVDPGAFASDADFVPPNPPPEFAPWLAGELGRAWFVGTGSDATQVAGLTAAKVGLLRAIAVGGAVIGATLSVYDLWKAASKKDRSLKACVETIRASTKEPRRILACMGNFLKLAVVLTRASPLPRRGGNLEELIAYALTEDANEDVLELVAMLGSDALEFDPTHSRVYSLQPVEYGPRGRHMYYKPTGWVRYSRKIPNFEKYEDWCVAYHGTRARDSSQRGVHLRLLVQGLLKPPTAWTTGQAWSKSGRSIYVSPSVEYASQYSALIPIHGDQEHWVQLVFQCRVRPGSFKVFASTLGHRWKEQEVRHDPNFSNAEVEWLLEEEANVVITGVMVREFGRKADPGTYGTTAAKVREDFKCSWDNKREETGAFFSWTWQRQEELLELTRQGLVRFP